MIAPNLLLPMQLGATYFRHSFKGISTTLYSSLHSQMVQAAGVSRTANSFPSTFSMLLYNIPSTLLTEMYLHPSSSLQYIHHWLFHAKRSNPVQNAIRHEISPVYLVDTENQFEVEQKYQTSSATVLRPLLFGNRIETLLSSAFIASLAFSCSSNFTLYSISCLIISIPYQVTLDITIIHFDHKKPDIMKRVNARSHKWRLTRSGTKLQYWEHHSTKCTRCSPCNLHTNTIYRTKNINQENSPEIGKCRLLQNPKLHRNHHTPSQRPC